MARGRDATEDEARAVAREAAERNGWPWKEMITARRRKRWYLFGPPVWDVHKNTPMRGANCCFVIDDASGRVLGERFYRRF